jgi:hypothetical protein
VKLDGGRYRSTERGMRALTVDGVRADAVGEPVKGVRRLIEVLLMAADHLGGGAKRQFVSCRGEGGAARVVDRVPVRVGGKDGQPGIDTSHKHVVP